MVRLSVSLLSAMFAISVTGAVHAAEAKPSEQAIDATPVQMVRTLQLMQDQIAAGSTQAHIGQRGLLAALEDTFVRLPDTSWADAKNIQAAIMFALSGGGPRVLRRILELGSLAQDDRTFVEGALAYVEGREEEAKKALLPLDATRLSPALGAQLAMVQSALLVRSDPRKSEDLLDFVRLQVPGTLLEEGALRREIFVTSAHDDARKFESLVTQYLHRFRHSVYSGNFRQRLASALTRIDFGKDENRFKRVEAMLAVLAPDVQRELFLMIAQSAVEKGWLGSALLASGKALALAGDDRIGAARARLYHAAAIIVQPKTLADGVEELKTIDHALLPQSDRALLDSALSLAQQIQSVVRADADKKPPDQVPVTSKASQASQQLPALLRAQEALNRVDALIRD